MRTEKGRFWTRYDKVQQAEPKSAVSDRQGKLYALLIGEREENGASSTCLKHLYETLVQSGIDISSISVLEGNDQKPSSASKLNLEKTLGQLRLSVTPEDRMLFYLAVHGTFLSNGDSGILLPGNETITPEEFAALSGGIPYNYGLFYFGNCLGGAFAEAVGYQNTIGISPVQKSSMTTGDSWKAAKRKAEKVGAINYHHPELGDYFANEFFYFVFKKGASIEFAFDQAVMRNSRPTFAKAFDPQACPGKITPQLMWQNADPAELHLGLPPI